MTPGVAVGTYDHPKLREKGYFDASANGLPGNRTTPGVKALRTPSGHRSNMDPVLATIIEGAKSKIEDVALSGSIISATFTIPHVLEYCRESHWVRRNASLHCGFPLTDSLKELKTRHRQSALLDSLQYLSRDSPWNHTVVAWTGEIGRQENADDPNPEIQEAVMPASTAITLGSTSSRQTRNRSVNVDIVEKDVLTLEQQLYDDELRILPVWLADDDDMTSEEIKLHDQSRWRRYAEHDLCALFHYKQHPPTDAYKDWHRWADYCRMNEKFADRICDIYKPGDIIMIHDYHLMLLPEILRQRCPEIGIAFILHTPFPSSELVRCLGRRKNVLEGVLGSNLIVFQSHHYAQHFANACTRILGYAADSKAVNAPGKRVHLDVLPVGINVSRIQAIASKQSVSERCEALKKLHSGKKLIVAYDPMDRLGGVDKKLVAFDKFLELYPEWRERVVLLQVISENTMEDDDGEEERYASGINELVGNINTKHGSLDYMPIQMHSQNLTEDEYFAMFRSGDVALITSIRDGMSTTSFEYIVCQRYSYGPTIISEFSGTASSLDEAIHVNPWDTTDVAHQINKALTMETEERQEMHAALYKRVTGQDVKHWVTSVIRRLLDVGP